MGEGELTLKGTAGQLVAGTFDACGVNPNRIGLIFTTFGAAGTTSCQPQGVPGVGSTPLNFSVGTQAPLEFWYSRHGPLPSCAWKILSGGAVGTWGIIEILKNG